MPAGTYINTPRSNIGNGTYLTNGLETLGEMSPEKSFLAPNENRDLISQMKNVRRGISLQTPRAGGRDPLRLLPNGGQGKAEFTPLMKSVAKNHISRRMSGKNRGILDTPAFLRDSYNGGGATPALPRMADNSHLQSERTTSSAGEVIEYTPMPQNVSSSTRSTPLAQLPGRDSGGVVSDGNMMTLREQENIIDKIEKENFGLKMKIHFLEEALSKRGNEFNQAALKENTDLKVNRITMQRELHKFKKNVAQAERDAEVYRLQLEEYRERIKRKQADESIRVEVERIQTELRERETRIEQLQLKLEAAEQQSIEDVEKLRDDLEDAQADVREKDRLLEDREDEIDALKANASKGTNIAAELEDELETAKRQIEDLKQALHDAAEQAKASKEDSEGAMIEKRKAEEDLAELRDEMANKSFTTKGLSRQLEEKANKLEDDFEDLQEQHSRLQREVEEKLREEKKLHERIRELEKEGAAESRQLQHNLDLAQQQRETAERKLNNMSKQLQGAESELQIKTDEKDLLQSRHDSLTTESAELQKDLASTQKTVQELESALEEERQLAAQNENILRTQHRNEADLLNEQIDSLHHEINAKESEHAANQDEWEAQKKTIEAAKQKAEEKATGLERTVNKFHESQSTTSSTERLQEALESEKQRHQNEERLLSRQIEELNADLAVKRIASDGSRIELSNAREELRISIREQAALKDKVAELEEEIEVLQADIEQEHDFAEQLQRKSAEGSSAQLEKIKKEKQNLQDQLAKVNIELHNEKRTTKAIESERDSLETKLAKAERSADDTFNIDQEKRELRRSKQRLEKDLDRLKTERDNLQQANKELEQEINVEIERASAEEQRLSAEIDLVRNKQIVSSDTRDRELTSSKNKVQRLETRIKELEDLLDNQTKIISSPDVDLSGLKNDLASARKNETAAAKRESDLKSKNRDLRTQISNLEGELHEAHLARFRSKSPSVSPGFSNSKEITQLRQELADTRTQLNILETKNQDLMRRGGNLAVDDTERADLRALLKSSTVAAETLAVKLSDREAHIQDLRQMLKRVREERNTDNSAKDLTSRPSIHENEARSMKNQLKLLREERSIANKKAEVVEHELEIMQGRYEAILEKLMSSKSGHSKDNIREKEVRGLIKEISWLKAKCRREEQFRKDLAWSKEYMEQGEVMRAHCNQIDLNILREMGVRVDRRQFQKQLKPVQKLRAGVFTVIAAIRMSNLEQQWRSVRQVGEELKAVKAKSLATRQQNGGVRTRVV